MGAILSFLILLILLFPTDNCPSYRQVYSEEFIENYLKTKPVKVIREGESVASFYIVPHTGTTTYYITKDEQESFKKILEARSKGEVEKSRKYFRDINKEIMEYNKKVDECRNKF